MHTHDDDEAPQSLIERLILSETLGTVSPRMVKSTAVAIYTAQHAAPEWVAGRYHECIASILRFPDLAAEEVAVATDAGQRGTGGYDPGEAGSLAEAERPVGPVAEIAHGGEPSEQGLAGVEDCGERLILIVAPRGLEPRL